MLTNHIYLYTLYIYTHYTHTHTHFSGESRSNNAHFYVFCLPEFKECFSLYDKKRKGKIEARDLITVMRSLGTSPTFGEVDRHLVVHKIGTDSTAVPLQPHCNNPIETVSEKVSAELFTYPALGKRTISWFGLNYSSVSAGWTERLGI